MTDEIISPTSSDIPHTAEVQAPLEPSAQEIATLADAAEAQHPIRQSGTIDAEAPQPAEPASDAAAENPGGLDGRSPAPEEPAESFGDLLSAFERSHTHRTETRQLDGTVVSLTADQVVLDIGYKMEGVLPRSSFADHAEGVKPGDRFPVSITGRNEEGYYQLSRFRVAQPRDWSALERAFQEKLAVAGTVTAVIKGGLSIDIGVRAFMPASRSGTRDAAELEALVGQQITCRITKLDVADEDVVVDRRVVLEEQARAEIAGRRAALQPGDTVTGTVRTLMPYGAFVEIEPGLDGLLHISDISRAHIARPDDMLSVGQQLTLRILKIDPETSKISLGLKQLEPDPWDSAPDRYPVGARVTGSVVRLKDFGAFIQIAEGVDGLVHVSEIVADRRINHPRDVLREGQQVKALVLAIDQEKRQVKLSIKQLIPTSIDEYIAEHKVGDRVSGRVVELTPSGAIVELGEGIRAACCAPAAPSPQKPSGAGVPSSSSGAASGSSPARPDLSQLSSMLKARWKGNAPAPSAAPEPLAESQIRNFKIVKLEPDAKRIEVELG